MRLFYLHHAICCLPLFSTISGHSLTRVTMVLIQVKRRRKRPSAIKSFLRFKLWPQSFSEDPLATVYWQLFTRWWTHLRCSPFCVSRTLWSNNRQLTEIYFDQSLLPLLLLYENSCESPLLSPPLPKTNDRNSSEHDEDIRYAPTIFIKMSLTLNIADLAGWWSPKTRDCMSPPSNPAR